MMIFCTSLFLCLSLTPSLWHFALREQEVHCRRACNLYFRNDWRRKRDGEKGGERQRKIERIDRWCRRGCWGKEGTRVWGKNREGGVEGNFQGRGSLSGSFLTSADRDTQIPQWTWWLQNIILLCACTCVYMCLAHPHTHIHIHTNTHLFCPSQSSGNPAGQLRQERITALCHVVVTSLSHISSCHSLQGEKGRRRGARALLCQTSTPPLLTLICFFFSLFCQCLFFCMCNTLSHPCRVTGVLCKY